MLVRLVDVGAVLFCLILENDEMSHREEYALRQVRAPTENKRKRFLRSKTQEKANVTYESADRIVAAGEVQRRVAVDAGATIDVGAALDQIAHDARKVGLKTMRNWFGKERGRKEKSHLTIVFGHVTEGVERHDEQRVTQHFVE